MISVREEVLSLEREAVDEKDLAPNIQQEILFLSRTMKGRDPICEKDVRPVAAVFHWTRQRKMWAKLVAGRLN
ncbi:MAG: hypothetical protein JRI58_08735 [Deltaproteobacteria bacterium]|nr:hypothetical protein [Deltaproteobacteria bacterium]MBW2074815.1 hypothetical protein [Deltaproteobacteria bacterium]RLB82917.1 MAG: hypothetical protein DRH17_03950 [Deltaproteobacteria bacterium]